MQNSEEGIFLTLFFVFTNLLEKGLIQKQVFFLEKEEEKVI